MDIAYLHVVINHLPIMAVPVLLAVLLLGLWTRSTAVQRAALLGFVAIGIATVAVYLTGLGAEDFAEHLPEVADDDVIEAHEAMATVAFGVTGVLALLAALAFMRSGGAAWLRRRDVDGVAVRGAWPVVAAAVVAAAALGATGKLGGRITHTEFAGAPAGDQHAVEEPADAAADAAEDAADDAADAAEEAAEEAAEAEEELAEEAAEAAEDAADGKRRRRRGRG